MPIRALARYFLRRGLIGFGGPVTLVGQMEQELVGERKWLTKEAAMRGIGPAVIGVLAVSLFQLAPHALPHRLALAVLGATVIALVLWRVGTVKLMIAGAVLGIARSRLASLHTLKAALSGSLGLRI